MKQTQTKNIYEMGKQSIQIKLSDIIVPFRCMNYANRVFDAIESNTVRPYICAKHHPSGSMEYGIAGMLTIGPRLFGAVLANMGMIILYGYAIHKGIERMLH